MCGRFDRHSELDAFAQLIEGLAPEPTTLVAPSYNIAPSQKALVVMVDASGSRKCQGFDWGLVPSWVDRSDMSRPINARMETVEVKPMFRQAFRIRRCLVLCDGYYEWARTGSGKQPHYFHMSGQGPFVMAGLWENNSRLTQQPIHSFCILTRDANSNIGAIHHRMPVVLEADAVNVWMDSDMQATALKDMLAGQRAESMEYYPVSTFVNSPANNTAQCRAPIK